LDDIPKNLIGMLIGDRVRAKRIERMAVLSQRIWERLHDRGIDPEPPSLKYAIPILEAAADDENGELQDLWSRLLAAAMDPNRRDAMRQSFIATVKQMDPIDVVILKAIYENGTSPWQESAHAVLGRKLELSVDEIRVSIKHLDRLDCISGNSDAPYTVPFGKLLMNVVSG
jgi:Abortive infection alpha